MGDDDYEKIYLFPNSHAGYYPGAKPLALKFIFRKSDGRVLGAQALGEDGPAVDKRISALAVAMQMGATVYDLEEAELCYAPQFGSAKDAVNFAGMIAADVLDGDMPLAHWDSTEGRVPARRAPAAASWSWKACRARSNIPLPELRARLGELPKDREILVICRSAQRAYYATRILLQNGFRARNLSGACCRGPCSGTSRDKAIQTWSGRLVEWTDFTWRSPGAIGSQHDVHESNP